ncbi:hypothetical protein Mal15_56740 [Stieleria maiorica]|uniref:Uncharacterized protein n=2 Tax=Stieleria maiorica TaxID=2795974 RepID=A0A5B9MNV4_9BACT|nr:hypothetical protein Mal15_56740 [Stieleria maiorica]
MSHAWASLAKHKQKRLAIEGIINPLWDRFGGSMGIANAWMAAYSEATAVRRIRSVEALIALLDWVAQHPDTHIDPTGMTDKELDREVNRASCDAMSSILATNPDLAATIAAQHGFILAPLATSLDQSEC